MALPRWVTLRKCVAPSRQPTSNGSPRSAVIVIHCTTTSRRRAPPDSERSLCKAALRARSSMQLSQKKLPGPGTVFLNVNWNFTAPVQPGDTITGRVEVTEVRADKPITKLHTTVTRDDRTVVLEGTAVCYTMTTRLTEEPTMSATTGPDDAGQDESQPDQSDAEKPEYQEKPVAGAEIGIMPEGEGSSFEPEEDPEAQG